VALTRDTLAQRVRDALRDKGMSQQQLAAAVDLDPTALSKALSGHRDLKSLEVALIAEHLGISTDLLLADDLAIGPSMAEARAAGVPAADADAVAAATGRVLRMRELDRLLDELGHPGPPAPVLPRLPESTDPVTQGDRLASAVHARMGFDGGLPAGSSDFARWLEDRLGLDICVTPLPPGVDGLAFSGGGLRLALVSSGIPATRQRFTLAHELCHVLAGDASPLIVDQNVLVLHSREERRAHAFAAAFLIPADALRDAVTGRPVDEDLVAGLLGRFRVSLDTLALRLHQLGLVDATARDRVRAMASARITLRPGRTDEFQSRHERRVPRRLLHRAMTAFAAGDLGIRPLADLLDADPAELLAELGRPRFRPPTGNTDEEEYVL
jgi:transcriptional regulator with XRE-family HTH domain